METVRTPRRQVSRTRALGIALAFALPFPVVAAADFVVPSERVRSRVVVREHSARGSRDVGSLRPGERATWLGELGSWHLVRLGDGTRGYVSASWTRVIAEALSASAPPPEALQGTARIDPSKPSFFKGLWRRLFEPMPEIEFVIKEPERGRTVYRHVDPNLPVSGYATAFGSNGHFDVVLVIDTSTSTNELPGRGATRSSRPRSRRPGTSSGRSGACPATTAGSASAWVS
jgi:hypothetical protein